MRLRKINGPYSIDYTSGSDRLQAQSGKDGNITLDQLRDDSHYWFFLDAPGHGRHLLSNVHADEDLTVKLGPELYISGEIHGDLEKLDRRNLNGKSAPYISVSNPYMIDGHSFSSSVWTPVTIRNGKGYFRFTNLWEGAVGFSSKVDQSRLALREPIEDLILNIVSQERSKEEEPRREIEIRIASPSDHPPVNGLLRITEYKLERDSYVYSNHKNISIMNGVARTEILVPGKFQYRAEDIPGFWLPESRSQIINEGESPFIVEAKAEPAGAIYGSIREEDGSPAESVLISVVESKRAPNRHQGSLDVTVKNSSFGSGDFIESFIAPSLPLGGEYAIVVHREDSYATTQAFPINTSQPLQRVSIVMPTGKNLNGIVTKRDGSPAAGVKYTLNFSTPYSHGFSREERLTGRDGGIQLTGINPDVHGTYYLNFEENSGYQRLNMEIDPEDSHFNVVLDSAYNVTGRVVEDTTGWPVQGVDVYVLPQPVLRIPGGHVNADSKTDSQGRFQFTTLDEGEYELHIRGGNTMPKDKRHIVRGGQSEEPLLRVKLSEWSKAKVVKPEE